ncbi:MAG: glycosyltransferase family 39 protein [Phycisphaerales bacterium]|nr:glycosyltransferase family 39 protein [Phycisphaerales bacterium]
MVAVSLFRVAYLAWWCPYTLLEDEAHYWEWSRRLDWSYYSKGPGVAWTIAASRTLFGDTEFGVRFPAVVLAAIAAVGAAGLARRATGEPRAGFFAALLMLLIPAFQFGGILMTIDMPYIAMWSLAAWAAWAALTEKGRWAWPLAAAALGAGFLYKYTALFLLPGLAAFALIARGRLALAPRWRWWAAAGVIVLLASMLPVVIWNARHGWPTMHHLLGHLGISGGDLPPPKPGDTPPTKEPFAPSRGLEFLGTQAALIGPAFILMILGSRWILRPDTAAGLGGRYLLCLAAPILLFYTLLTLQTDVEGNWALGGYLSLTSLAGWAVLCGMDHGGAGMRRLWIATLGVGLFVGLAPLRLDWLAASGPMRWVDRQLIAMKWMHPGRTLVPVGRLMGARAMAMDVQEQADRLRAQTGLEPMVIAEHYGRASLLAFYLPGRPTVYCSSSLDAEGRPTQYDFWKDTDLRDTERFRGRPAVLIGADLERWQAGFDRVVPLGRLEHEPKEHRDTFLGYGYKGFPG